MVQICLHFSEYRQDVRLVSLNDCAGFKIADKGCCGTGKIEVAELCTFVCSGVSDYVFWDSFHPTEKAYRFLSHQVLVQHLSSFF